MNKNEILAAAQKNKERGKEYENRISIKSSIFGALIAILVIIALCIIEYSIKHTLNCGLISVGMSLGGSQYLFEGIRVKKILYVVVGGFFSCFAVFTIFAFISGMVA